MSIPWKHASNSSAAIRFDLNQFNMVRIGLAVYGLHTSEEVKKLSNCSWLSLLPPALWGLMYAIREIR